MAARFRDILSTEWAWLRDLDGRSRNVLITSFGSRCQTKEQLRQELRSRCINLADLPHCGPATELRIKKWLSQEDSAAQAKLHQAEHLLRAHGYTVINPPMKHLETYQ